MLSAQNSWCLSWSTGFESLEEILESWLRQPYSSREIWSMLPGHILHSCCFREHNSISTCGGQRPWGYQSGELLSLWSGSSGKEVKAMYMQNPCRIWSRRHCWGDFNAQSKGMMSAQMCWITHSFWISVFYLSLMKAKKNGDLILCVLEMILGFFRHCQWNSL